MVGPPLYSKCRAGERTISQRNERRSVTEYKNASDHRPGKLAPVATFHPTQALTRRPTRAGHMCPPSRARSPRPPLPASHRLPLRSPARPPQTRATRSTARRRTAGAARALARSACAAARCSRPSRPSTSSLRSCRALAPRTHLVVEAVGVGMSKVAGRYRRVNTECRKRTEDPCADCLGWYETRCVVISMLGSERSHMRSACFRRSWRALRVARRETEYTVCA